MAIRFQTGCSWKTTSIDIVVELIGGIDAGARVLYWTALSAGKTVVTANKDLMAQYWPELNACG